jgi:hypothetical protein
VPTFCPESPLGAIPPGGPGGSTPGGSIYQRICTYTAWLISVESGPLNAFLILSSGKLPAANLSSVLRTSGPWNECGGYNGLAEQRSDAVISWCYKPSSHTHQVPGTGSDTQQ